MYVCILIEEKPGLYSFKASTSGRKKETLIEKNARYRKAFTMFFNVISSLRYLTCWDQRKFQIY